MNAGQRLLALSSLSSGTAAQLITNPAVGGGVVMNDGFEVLASTDLLEVELEAMEVELQLEPASVELELEDAVIVLLQDTAPIEIEVTE